MIPFRLRRRNPPTTPHPATPATAGAAVGQTEPKERLERPGSTGPGEGSHRPSRREYILGFADGRTYRALMSPRAAERMAALMRHPATRGNPSTPTAMIAAPEETG